MRLIFLSLMLIALHTKGQTVSGIIQNGSGQPLEAATVAVLKSTDSSVLKYTLTDKEGKFDVKGLPPTQIKILVSFAGYADRDTTIDIKGAVVLMIQLNPSVAALDGITIQRSKALFDVQPDKTVFNVSQSITAAGGTALELLQKSPGVLVDPNDGISMNGKTGVRVYIDGRPSPLSLQEITALLRTIPSTDVDAIEIITNPSARYEAAGNAGIINIRLKKNKSLGTNGSVTLGWAIGIFPKYNSGVSLNHRTKGINLFAGYSRTDYRNESGFKLFRFQNDSLFDQRSITIGHGNGNNIKLGADFFLSSNHTIGLLLNGNFSNSTSTTQSNTPIAAQSDGKLAQTLSAQTAGKRRRSNGSINLNYRFTDTTGRTLNIDADYSLFDVVGSAITTNRYTGMNGGALSQSGFSNRTPVGIQFGAVQASWEQTLAKGKLVAGMRWASAKTDNTFSFFNSVNGSPVFDGERSNQFDYTEMISAAFVQYNRSMKKWSYSMGLRAEQTNSLGDLTALNPAKDQRVKRSYLNLFPSGGLSYQLSQNHSLGISFSRRIDRPSYQDLNPFENRIDELTYQKGNPFLRPQFTNTAEAKHTYKYRLTTTLAYSDVNDFFAAITDTIEGRRNFITQRNIARQRIVALTSSLPFTLTSWWSGFASVGVSHNRYRAQFEPGKEIRINNTVANVYQQHSFTLTKKWSAEISSFYLSPYVWAGNYECRSIWNIDLGVQRKMFGDAATLKLTVTDIFQRMPWAGTSQLGDLLIVASGRWESRQLRLNFAYRFGNKNVKSARQRAVGVEDLNRRVQ